MEEIDLNGYKRGKISHSDLIHRQIAYEYIYLKHKEKYSLPFSKYVVHHKDGNKLNNDISNLEILTPEKHSLIHGYKTSQKTLDYLNKIENQRKRNEVELSQEIKTYSDYGGKSANWIYPYTSKREPKENESLQTYKSNTWNIAEARRQEDIKKGRKQYFPSNKEAKEEKETIVQKPKKSKRKIIPKIKSNTLFFFKYLKKAVILCIISLICLFIFPIAYHIIIYILWGLLLLLGYFIILIISFLFAKDNAQMIFIYEHSTFVNLLGLIRKTPPIVVNFIYGNNTKPLLVILVIIVTFIISYFLLKKQKFQ